MLYLLRTGCRWRLPPRGFPPRSTAYHYPSAWRTQAVWTRPRWALHRRVRLATGRAERPSTVVMDGQSVRTTERGGPRGFDAYKRIEGRKRHVLIDAPGLPIAGRVEPARTSGRALGRRLLGGLRSAFPGIGTVVADAGHEGREPAGELGRSSGRELVIVRRRRRASRIAGLAWIVERSLARLRRNRRLGKDHEYDVRTSEALIGVAAIRLILNRLRPA